MNTVDWEGLEKSEEQEARDDATDEEVSCSYAGKLTVADRKSPPLFC